MVKARTTEGAGRGGQTSPDDQEAYEGSLPASQRWHLTSVMLSAPAFLGRALAFLHQVSPVRCPQLPRSALLSTPSALIRPDRLNLGSARHKSTSDRPKLVRNSIQSQAKKKLTWQRDLSLFLFVRFSGPSSSGARQSVDPRAAADPPPLSPRSPRRSLSNTAPPPGNPHNRNRTIPSGRNSTSGMFLANSGQHVFQD